MKLYPDQKWIFSKELPNNVNSCFLELSRQIGNSSKPHWELTVWTFNDVFVDPYPFSWVKRVWINQDIIDSPYILPTNFLNFWIMVFIPILQKYFNRRELPFPAPMNLAMLGPRAETPPPFLACNNKTLGYFWHDVHCTGKCSSGLFRVIENFRN